MATVAARLGLNVAPSLITNLPKNNTSKYLSKISKNIDLNNLNHNDAQTLLNLGQNYNDGTLNDNHAQNVLDLVQKVKKSGGNYEKLNKKGSEYINKIQKEFRNKLNESYYKLITGGTSKKALKAFNHAGTEYGNKLVDKYLTKLENHAIKGGHPPHVVRNLLTKYGGALPEKLNRLIKKANKKIDDDDKKLKILFNTRDYTGGITKTLDFSEQDSALSESADMPSTNESKAIYNEFIAPNRHDIIGTEIHEIHEIPDTPVVEVVEPMIEPVEPVVEVIEPVVVPEPEIVKPVDADLTNVTATPELISEINELSEPTNAEAENIAAAKLALSQPTEQETDVILNNNSPLELPVEKIVVMRDEILGQQTEVPDDVNERLNKLQNQLDKLRNNSNDNDSDSDKSIKINFKPIITMTMNGSDDQKKNMN